MQPLYRTPMTSNHYRAIVALFHSVLEDIMDHLSGFRIFEGRDTFWPSLPNPLLINKPCYRLGNKLWGHMFILEHSVTLMIVQTPWEMASSFPGLDLCFSYSWRYLSASFSWLIVWDWWTFRGLLIAQRRDREATSSPSWLSRFLHWYAKFCPCVELCKEIDINTYT